MSKGGLRVRFEQKDLDDRLEQMKRAFLPQMKAEIESGCAPYVPYKTGALLNSSKGSAAAPDEHLIYDIHYAKAQYYRPFGGQWFEKWKGSVNIAAIARNITGRLRF
ncbi:MAG: minor capsid protein [Christensenellales bacterium]